jgi:hypothetical protein
MPMKPRWSAFTVTTRWIWRADLIDGEVRFFGLQSPGLSLEGCDLHRRLLKEYEKAHAVAVNP